MTFETESFDRIICFETIEHVPDPRLALKELFRILKPGGEMILTTPNYFNLYGIYRIYLRITGRKWSEVGQPINQFVMIGKTKRWLKNAGFKIKKYYSTEYSFPFIDGKIHHIKRKKFLFSRYLGLQSYFLVSK